MDQGNCSACPWSVIYNSVDIDCIYGNIHYRKFKEYIIYALGIISIIFCLPLTVFKDLWSIGASLKNYIDTTCTIMYK